MSSFGPAVVIAVLSLALIPLDVEADAGTLGTLTATSGQGSGLIKVAPTAHDMVGPDTFDVEGTIEVRDAAPDTAFSVLRRVDLYPDGNCTGGTWLQLPPPTPNLLTSAGGAGAVHFAIARGAPFVDGVSFDVQWRLAGSDGSMLESNCLTVLVK